MTLSQNALISLGILLFTYNLKGHEEVPVTHEFGPFNEPRDESVLQISVLDSDTGEPLNARLSFEINGDYWAPQEVNEHGIRFTSLHKSKQQQFTVIYALNSGPTIINYPAEIDSIKVTASRGFEYSSTTAEINLKEQSGIVKIRIKRWSALRNYG